MSIEELNEKTGKLEHALFYADKNIDGAVKGHERFLR